MLRRASAFAEIYGPAGADRRVVGVCLHPGRDLHAAFVGGLLAGHIPTMLPPPSPRMEAAKYARSLLRMMEHVHPDILVISHEIRSRLVAEDLARFEGAAIVDPGQVGERDLFTGPRQPADSIAVLQHSSGTTGQQKGIALSHEAILEHNRRYTERLEITPADRIVTWLPLYHDMGFVACFLLPTLDGIPFAEMSPFDWVLRPVMLLEEIWKQRGTLCWLPNFAFSYLATAIAQSQIPEGLDLSSIRAWINCSEPVMPGSIEAFLERFSAYGASRRQITASYAMAENVYAVTQSKPGSYATIRVDRKIFLDDHRAQQATGGDERSLTFVSNGTLLEGCRLRVVDESRRDVSEGFVGEIAISGEFRFDGYFRRPDLTAEAIDSDGWYYTGDLGFVIDGSLYLTGRKKDLMIIQGRNFYPTDVEEIVRQVEGVNPGRVVAFGIPDETSGTERLVVLVEALSTCTLPPARLALDIRREISQALDCTAGDVRIVPERWLVKSTSGKLARNDNRAKYLDQIVIPTKAAGDV